MPAVVPYSLHQFARVCISKPKAGSSAKSSRYRFIFVIAIVIVRGVVIRLIGSKDSLVYDRPHLSLDRNSPTPRRMEPPSKGEIVAVPQVGGLHHRYTRRAA